MGKLKLSSLMLACFVLAGCGALDEEYYAAGYTPLTQNGVYGYSNSPRTKNTFDVSFRGSPANSSDSIRDFVLLRSAEVAQANGFPYFLILDRQTIGDYGLEVQVIGYTEEDRPDNALKASDTISRLKALYRIKL